MKTPEELAAVQIALTALADQVQAIVKDAPISMAAFVLFSTDGPIEYRSPHPRETLVKHLKAATHELGKPQ